MGQGNMHADDYNFVSKPPTHDGDEMVESIESRIARYQIASPNPIVCICGSMKFFTEMVRTAHRLTLEGNIVLMPLVRKDVDLTDDEKSQQHLLEQSLPDGINLHIMLDAMHRNKIDMSDKIVVVTNMQHYIGDSTKAEIAYAASRAVDIEFDTYVNPLPRQGDK